MKKIGLLLAFFLVTQFISAQQLTVPGEYSTIQAAIEAAVEGDSVVVAEGTYKENINFLGKAITVGSEFLLDRDTTHISRTIIDGSEPSNPDSASVVLLVSGEDTTSVLSGFTITGGSGVKNSYGGLMGGGILMHNCGGKIINNIITDNQLDAHPKSTIGSGIFARVIDNHYAIIRNNTISNNISKGDWCYGGGIEAVGGGILIENNRIINNTSNAQDPCLGVGIDCYADGGHSTAIKSLIIRNNEIVGNTGTGDPQDGIGGGINLWMDYNDETPYARELVQVYNNVIADNYLDGYGGGISVFWNTCALIYNNTIVNNVIASFGNSLIMTSNTEVAFYNNILWSDLSDGATDLSFIHVSDDNKNTVKFDAMNNIFPEPYHDWVPVSITNTMFSEPIFKSGTYELEDGSQGIGRGADSVQFRDIWYLASQTDYSGNPRPHASDEFIDLGAFESEYAQANLNNANLFDLYLNELDISPDFDPEILNYELEVHGNFQNFTSLEAIPEDFMATVDIDHATESLFQGEEDYTSTITVTAPDGATQKIYSLSFKIYVGITQESVKHSGFTSYPNPFSETLHLEFNGEKLPSRIEMINMTGSLVKTIENISSNKLTIDRGTLPAGLYFVKIYADQVYVNKVMIQ